MHDQTVDEKRVFLNGLDASTGHYLEGPKTLKELADMAEYDTRQRKEELAAAAKKHQETEPSHFLDLDPNEEDYGRYLNLAQSGWGVIFAHDAKQELREALSELLDYRHDEAGDLYKEYWKRDDLQVWTRDGYMKDETWDDFLVRQEVGGGLAKPRKMPYYLLIVGAPQNIPFSFQYRADLHRAVGRIDFGDDLAAYRRYAHSVVEAERAFSEGRLGLPRRAAFFGAANTDDRATARSYDEMMRPIYTELCTGDKRPGNWELDLVEPNQATKPRLKQLLGGSSETPAIVFTATHGLGFKLSDHRLKDDRTLQFRQQGALVCKEWPGPQKWGEALKEEFYLSADDIDDNAHLWGSIAVHFACFGAGTPALNEYVHRLKQLETESMQIAPVPFVAGLPKRLLSHPNGGALAVVGHVDRAWACSFRLENAKGTEIEDFDPMKTMLVMLMAGHRVGFALESMNARYADRASSLTTELYNINHGMGRDDFRYSRLWTAHNDARAYTVIGDPAVRLPLSQTATALAKRPTVEFKASDQPYTIQTGNGQVTPDEATTPPPQIESQQVDYSIFNRRREAPPDGQTVVVTAPGTVQQFIDRLGEALRNAVTEASTVQVTTYVSFIEDTVDGDQVEHFLDARRIRGVTRVSLNGSVEETLPPDETWQAVHRASVDQAIKNRNELLNTAVSALVGLFTPAKGS